MLANNNAGNNKKIKWKTIIVITKVMHNNKIWKHKQDFESF